MMVRKIDKAGRIVLTKEYLKEKNLENAQFEFFTDGNRIVIKPYKPGCIFCNSIKNIESFNGKNICKKCRGKINES